MSDRRAILKARGEHAMILTLLSTRSQAQVPWTYKELRWQMERLGHPMSLETVKRHVLKIRGRGARRGT